MKFSCLNTDFTQALSKVQKASSPNPSFPILEGILIEADEGILVTGNNLQIGIEYFFEANVQEKGKVTIDAKIVFEILRRVPEGIIFFEVKGENMVNIKCADLDFNIAGQSGEDFPKIPDSNYEFTFKLNPSVINGIVKRTSFAIAQTELKPIFTGIKLEFKEDKITAVALDGYRMALAKIKTKENMPECSCIIPGKAMTELSKIIGSSEDNIIINISDKNVLFEMENCRFFSRLLEGEFVNYETIIPKEYKYNVIVKTEEFINSIDMAALIAGTDSAKTPIKITYEPEKITVSCAASKGNFKDVINVKSESKEVFEVGYNHKFMLDALKNTDCEHISVNVVGSVNPTAIMPVDNDDFLFIIVPLRLK